MNETKRLIDEMVGQDVTLLIRCGWIPEKLKGRLETSDDQFVKLNLGSEGSRRGIRLVSIAAIHWIALRK